MWGPRMISFIPSEYVNKKIYGGEAEEQRKARVGERKKKKG